MSSKIEIALEEANGELVTLKNMSAEALSSFLAVIGSFKAIIEDQYDENSISYAIVEGSASFEVKVNNNKDFDSFYSNFNTTIERGSTDKILISKLKNIQGYLNDKNLLFKFNYYKNGNAPVDLKQKVISSKIIHRRNKDPYVFKLEIKSGLLNQVGGNNPNYHLDHGNNDRYTIFCSKENAQEINQYLYKSIKVLVLSKVYNRVDKFDNYYHKAILNSSIVNVLSEFLRNYNKKNSLLDKLDYLYDFTIDLSKDKSTLLEFLSYILIGFNSNDFHPSELKTILVISKGFKNKSNIESERKLLLETYNLLIQKK